MAARAQATLRKGEQLASRARDLSAMAMNLLTSAAMVTSVVLGAKNIDVSGRQLDLAHEQIETSKTLAASVGSQSGARGEAWEQALEAMIIDEAVAAGSSALVRSFSPPEVLSAGGEATTVGVTVQSLANEPLRGVIEGRVSQDGGWPALCQLPGCTTADDETCPCHNPIRYEFVIEPMHELALGLPVVLDARGLERCPARVQVDYTLQLQDEKGVLRPLAKRRVIYQRDGERSEGCEPGTEYRFATEDTWAGEVVTESAVAGETESEPTADEAPVEEGAETPPAAEETSGE